MEVSNEMIIAALGLPSLVTALFGIWVRRTLANVEEIPKILLRQEHLLEKFLEHKGEMNARLDKLLEARDEQIRLQASVKAAWKKIDDLHLRMRDL